MKKMTATFMKKTKKNFFMLFFIFLFLNVVTLNVSGQNPSCFSTKNGTILTQTTIGQCVCTLTITNKTYDVTSSNIYGCGTTELNKWNFYYVLDGATNTTGTGTLSGVSFNKGQTGVTWTAVYKTNTSITHIFDKFYINVQDVQAPTIDCPANITVSAAPGTDGAIVDYPLATANDNCGISYISKISGLESGSVFPVGTSYIQYEASDIDGNKAYCTFAITVEDTEPPTLILPNSIVDATNVLNGRIITYDVSAFDNSGLPVSIELLKGVPSGGLFYPTETWCVFKATDVYGNYTIDSFLVQIVDNIDPVITCPANLLVSNDVHTCFATVDYVVDAYDNCPLFLDVYNVNGPIPGDVIPVGSTYTITWVAADSKNTATCTFTITAYDTEPPQINIAGFPTNIDEVIDPAICGKAVTYDLPTAIDNCSQVSALTFSQTAGLPSGSVFPAGITTNTIEYVDELGNIGAFNFTVTVTDVAPAITCPQPISKYVNEPDFPYAATQIDLGTPTGLSLCYTNLTNNAPAFYSAGNNVVTWTLQNKTGATATCMQNINLIEVFPPDLSVPADIYVNNDLSVCGATVPYTTPTFTGGLNAEMHLVSGKPSNSVFPVGTTTNVYQVTDAMSNTITKSFNVTVVDTEAPVVNFPTTIQVNTDPGICSAVVDYNPIVTDNCTATANIIVTKLEGIASGQLFPIGVTTNKYQYADAAGNATIFTFTVTVIDNSIPSIIAPPDITLTLNANQIPANVDLGLPDVTNNCSVVSYTNNFAPDPNGAGAYLYPEGTTNVIWTVITGSGTASAIQHVTIIKNQVIEPLTVNIDKYVMPELCGGGCSLTVNPHGAEYTYLWSTGETTAVIKITVAGTYTVNVTNTATGQTGVGTIVITVDYLTGGISSYVLLAWDKISLMQNNVYSGGLGTLKAVTSDISVKKSTIVAANTFVKSPTITVQDGSVVTNRITGPAGITLPAFEHMTYQSSDILKIPNNTTWYVSGTLYKQIEVGKNSTAVFTEPATYIQDNVKLSQGSMIKFAQCAKVIIGNELNTKADCIINPDDIGVTFYMGNNMIFGKNNKVTGTYYSKSLNPNAPNPLENNLKVQLSDQTNHGVYKGIFMAQIINFDGNNDLYLNQNCDYCPVYNPVTFTCPANLTICYDEGNIKVRDNAPEQLIGVESITTNQPDVFPVGTTKVTWTVYFINKTKITCTQYVTRLGQTNVTIAESGSFLNNNKVLTASYTGIQVATYKWSTGDITPSIAIMEPGSYTVTATTINGCDIVSTILVQLNKKYDDGDNTAVSETADMVLSNYPNPCKDKTTITFMLPEDNFVCLKVYDLSGKLIQTLFYEQAIKNKEYSLEFDGSKYSAGIYLYKLTTNNKVVTKKISMIK